MQPFGSLKDSWMADCPGAAGVCKNNSQSLRKQITWHFMLKGESLCPVWVRVHTVSKVKHTFCWTRGSTSRKKLCGREPKRFDWEPSLSSLARLIRCSLQMQLQRFPILSRWLKHPGFVRSTVWAKTWETIGDGCFVFVHPAQWVVSVRGWLILCAVRHEKNAWW